MKDIYKNPMFYYILVPVILAVWPLLVWAVYIPRVQEKWQVDKTQYEKAQKIIAEILLLDPDRLKFTGPKNKPAEFDYAVVVEKIASLCKIPPTSYELNSGRITTSSGQKSQSANVGLNEIDITRFAKFLSMIQLRWTNLQCTKVSLKQKKGLPDVWDFDLSFKYYY